MKKQFCIFFLTLGIFKVLADAQVLQNVNGTTVAGATAGQSVTNNGTLTANVVIGDGARGVVNGASSGAVSVNADGSATTAAQVNALFPGFIGTNNNANALVIFTNNGVSLSVNSSGVLTLTNYAAASLGFVWHTNGSGTNTGNIQSATLNTTGVVTAGSGVNAISLNPGSANGITVGTGSGGLFYSGVGYLYPRSDGVMTLINVAGTDWSRLQFGGTTAAFPSLKRSNGDLKLSDGAGTGTTNNWFVPGISSSTNGFASYAADATVALTSTGITNALGKDGTAYVTATAIAFTIKDRSQATLYTSPTLTATIPVHLQNGWSVNAASGLAGTLIAD